MLLTKKCMCRRLELWRKICFEEYVLFRWDLYSVIYGLVVLQRRRTDIRLPRLAVYDINHTLNPINSADSWNRTTDLWVRSQCSTSELSRPPNLPGFLLDVMVICFEEYVLFRWDLYSVIYGLVVLQRRGLNRGFVPRLIKI